MHMIYKRSTWKWAVCFLTLLVTVTLQTTPFLFPTVSGIRPVLLVPFVTAVAAVEGTTAGGVFGVLAGLFWDLSATAPFGFHGLFLMAVGIVTGLLLSAVFHPSILSALLLSLGFTFVMELLSWAFLDYMTGGQDFVYSFFRTVVPTTLYSFAFVIPLYFWIRRLHLRLAD